MQCPKDADHRVIHYCATGYGRHGDLDRVLHPQLVFGEPFCFISQQSRLKYSFV